MERVTIYDIARIAKVSASTVSRAISGNAPVKKATQERIFKIMREYNYIPNAAARALVTQSSRMVGVLVTDLRTTQHTSGIYYIERELSANGYSCLIYNTGRREEDWVRYIRMLSEREVDAAILMGSIYQSETVRQALQTHLPQKPVVLCNGNLDAPNVYSILANERSGVERCMQFLAERGRKRPAFLLNQITPSNLLKQEGYTSGVAAYFPDWTPLPWTAGNTTLEAYESIRSLLRAYPEVDSLVCSEDLMGLIALRALADSDRRVPEDISVIGINNSYYSMVSIPTLTSLDNGLEEMSVSAAGSVLALLRGERIKKLRIIDTKIVERQST